jgi:hypothetical protein
MSLHKRSHKAEDVVWRQCLECGNRYQSANHGYKVNWCSTKCETSALRRQRDDIETSWMRASWFLR